MWGLCVFVPSNVVEGECGYIGVYLLGFQFAYYNYEFGEIECNLCLPCENVVWQKVFWVKEYSSPLT